MKIKEPKFYFAVGMSKGELLPPYDSDFNLDKVNSFHNWLKTVDHESFGDNSEIEYNMSYHINFLKKNNFNPVGVCGSYEDMCVAAATFDFVSANFDVYIPKERSFSSGVFMYGGLRDRLSSERIFINSSQLQVSTPYFHKPNFDDLVSCIETDVFYYFKRKD